MAPPTNDVLISIPLFVLMGYVMEREASSTRCSIAFSWPSGVYRHRLPSRR